MTKTMWHYALNGTPKPIPRSVQPPHPEYIRHRSPSKRHRDQTRSWQWLEKKRIFQEAYRDQLESIGEVTALTSAPSIGIYRAEVLVDPKLHYRHPKLR